MELYTKFTDDNLSKVTFLNESSTENNKTLDKAKLQPVTDEETGELKLIATFVLKDIDTK